MPLNDADVREILRIIDESELDELSIETDGFSLHVRKSGASEDAPLGVGGARSEPVRESTDSERAPAAPAGPSDTPASTDALETVLSPMLGTFYRAEAPGAEPFVEVGATVHPETTVCIIEVMKMMNSVPAGVSGTIAEVVPENGQLVEYGEPLFRVKPAG